MNNIIFKITIGFIVLLLLTSAGYLTYYLLNKENKAQEPVVQLTDEEKLNIYDLIIDGNINEYEKYLNDGRKLSFAFKDKSTPLDLLIEQNDILSATKLIESGFDLTLVDNNHIDTVTAVLAHNKFIQSDQIDHIAIELIKQIKDEIEEEDTHGYSLLINAISTNNYSLVEEILKYIKDINRIYNNETALTFACLNGETDVRIIKLLVEKGSDVNIVTNKGNNSLMKAITYEQYEVIEYLLTETNINVNHKNDEGQTALHIAVDNSNFIGIDLLLDNSNINKDEIDNYGKTARDYAVEYSKRQPRFNDYIIKL